MKFETKQEDGKLIVEVELPASRRTGAVVPRQRVRTEDVIKELAAKNIEHGKVIQTADVKNWREHTRRGTWVFEEKSKKTLDKPREKVILVVEKKETAKKLKTKRKSRKKITEV